mmetsp:Transcript_58342/g.190277  ORF Transcript_58342/g.190277 Transcript_58342/m.190277 type:complete len:285 (-) Transcript_58342:20-874(-)
MRAVGARGPRPARRGAGYVARRAVARCRQSGAAGGGAGGGAAKGRGGGGAQGGCTAEPRCRDGGLWQAAGGDGATPAGPGRREVGAAEAAQRAGLLGVVRGGSAQWRRRGDPLRPGEAAPRPRRGAASRTRGARGGRGGRRDAGDGAACAGGLGRALADGSSVGALRGSARAQSRAGRPRARAGHPRRRARGRGRHGAAAPGRGRRRHTRHGAGAGTGAAGRAARHRPRAGLGPGGRLGEACRGGDRRGASQTRGSAHRNFRIIRSMGRRSLSLSLSRSLTESS